VAAGWWIRSSKSCQAQAYPPLNDPVSQQMADRISQRR